MSAPAPRIGLWGGFDLEDHTQASYAQVVCAELGRRLPTAHIRVFAPYGPERRSPADRGEPAEALGAWSTTRIEELRAELDLVLVGGADLTLHEEARATLYGASVEDIARRQPSRFLLGGLGSDDDDGPSSRWHAADEAAEAALRRAGVDGTIDRSPHPAALADRLFPATVLQKRLQFLRLMGWYPQDGVAIVVQGGADLVTNVAALARALCGMLADDPSAALVVLDLPGSDGPVFATALAQAIADGVGSPTLYRVPASASHEDVTATLQAASGFIGSSVACCLTALAFATPAVRLRPVGVTPPSGADQNVPAIDLASVTHDADALAAALARASKGQADGQLRRGIQADVDRWLDLIAEDAMRAAARRHPEGPPPAGTAALASELRALRRAWRVRTERSHLERVMLADRAARTEVALHQLQSEAEVLREEVGDLRARADREAAARHAAETECAAMRRTRTFRWTASARSLYRLARRPRR